MGALYPLLESHPLLAPLLFVAVHVLLAVLFLPCSPMTLMAGVLWGGGYGLAISMFAAIASSATTFLLSRGFLHSRIERLLTQRYPKAARILAQAALHDWKIIAVSQVNPLMPSSTLGYVFGLSNVSFKRYIIFSALFMLPLQLLFVITGHSLINLLLSGERWEEALISVVLVAIVFIFGKRIYIKICRFLGVKNEA